MRARVVVVGGGVMGVSIALHLGRRLDPIEDPVVLLEKTALAAGSSGRSGAILRQHYSSRELAGMARDSLKVYASFQAHTGRSVGFQRTGVLTLAGPDRPEDVALVRSNVAMMIELGIDTRCVEAEEIRRLVPGIAVREGSVGGWEPDGGVADPVRTVETFAALARSCGATIRVGTEVTSIAVERGRVRGVITPDGAIEASTVVVAAGPWTRRLLSAAGVDLPLLVLRPEQHFVEMPLARGEPRARREMPLPQREMPPERGVPSAGDEIEERYGPLDPALPDPPHPVLLDLEKAFYARCEVARARTRVGGMDLSADREVPDPDRLDEEVGAPFRAWARKVLVERLPVYAARPDVDALAAMYTMTPDSQAVIGALEGIEGLFVASGFSGHGFKLAPSIGEGVAQLVLGEPVSAFDPEFFAPGRFAPERIAETRARAGRGFGL